MHTSYTVGITTGEYLALDYVMIDQQEWIENAIKERARVATIEIVNLYSQYKINRGEVITAVGTTNVMQAAYDEGVIKKWGTWPTHTTK